MSLGRIASALCSLGIAAMHPTTSFAQTVAEASSTNSPFAALEAVTWEKLPGKHEFRNYEPDRAQRMARMGDSSMRCDLVAAGTLTTCTVVAETPAEFGFGGALLKLSRFFKAAPSAKDRPVSISVHWDYRGHSTVSTENVSASPSSD